MRFLPLSLMVFMGLALIGCQGNDVKGIDAVDSTSGGSSAPAGGGTTGENSGGTGSTAPEGGTVAPGGGSASGGPAGGPPGAAGGPGAGGVSGGPSMPAGASAAASEDLKGIEIPMYPGAAADPENKDSKVPTSDGTQTMVTRLTSDSFDKVKAFYADKMKWTEKTEVEGLAIFEYKNGKVTETLGINDRGDKRAVQITRMEGK